MIKDFAVKLDFPIEAAEFFQECYNKYTANERWKGIFDTTVRAYLGGDTNLDALHAAFVGEAGDAWQSVDMTLLLCCAMKLQGIYKEKGLPESLFWATMKDLKCKLHECKNCFDCWGTFVTPWFHRFFLCERFQFGRLQFEKNQFSYANYKGIVKKGDVVYNCHIPSTGEPLSTESVINALKAAYEFYKADLKGEAMPVVCSSWLLYGPLEMVFPEGTNVASYRKLFDVLENVEDKENKDFWRVFNKEYDEEWLQKFQPKTRLQARLKDYLQSGGFMGSGYGIFLFDGEKILK